MPLSTDEGGRMSFVPKAEVPSEVADNTAGRSTSLSPTEVIPLVSGRGRVVARPIARDLHWHFRNTKTSSYAFFSGVFALCIGPVDEFDSIIVNGKSYQGIYKLRTSYPGTDYINQVLSKETPETFRFWWGLEDQANPTRYIQSLVRDANHPEANKTHPRMKGIAWMGVQDMEAGQAINSKTPAIPKIEIELYCRSRAAYSFGHVEHGSNPIGTIRDLFTLQRGGLGLGSSVIDATQWAASAQRLWDDGVAGISGDKLFTSHVFDKPRAALDVAAEVAGHFGGFLREQDGNLDVDWQPNDGSTSSPTGLREISLHHLTAEPVIDPEGLDKMATQIIVSGLDYTSDPPLQEDSQEAMVPFARRLLGETRPAVQLNRKGFVTPRQLMSAAVMEATQRATPLSKIRLSVLRQYAVHADGVTPLRPGDRFTLDWEPIGLDVVVRVMERSKETATSVDFQVQVERGAFPRPYEPAIDPRVDLSVEPPVDLVRYEVAQLPPDLSNAADTQVVALVERPSNSAMGFKVQFSPDDSWPGQEIENGNTRWAVAAVLQTPMPAALGEVTVTVNAVGTDWPYLASQSSLEQSDDQLLVHHGGEWMSIGTITPQGLGNYTLNLRRARLASEVKAHSVSAVLMLIKRSDLVALEHTDFANVEDGGSYDAPTATKHFKLRSYNSGAEGNLTASTSVQLRDPTPDQVIGVGVVMQQKLAKLSWTALVGALINEYQVHRESWNGSTWNDDGLIGEVGTPDYWDVVPAFGLYRWRVRAVATDETLGTFSGYVEGTASTVGADDVDDSVPTTPGAPVFDNEGTYLTDDGTALAYIQVDAPSLPADGKRLVLHYRRSGSSTWEVANNNVTPRGIARIDDLSAAVAYQFAFSTLSFAGTPSAFSTVLSRTAPVDGTMPGAPSGMSASTDFSTHGSPPARYLGLNGPLLGACWLFPGAPTAKDVSRLEVSLTLAGRYSRPSTQVSFHESTAQKIALYASPVFLYLRIWARWWDRSGNAGAWAYVDSGFHQSYAGDLGSQNSDDAHFLGRRTGNTGTAKKVVAEGTVNWSGTLSGENPTETETISLPNGFTTKPDGPSGGTVTNTGILWRYDWDSASSTSSQVSIVFFMPDGSDIPASAAVRLQAAFFQHT